MVKWLALALLALPALEIGAFIALGVGIGFLPTIGLLLAMTILGVLVLRQAGREGLASIKAAMESGAAQIEPGGLDPLKVLAGLLLVVPGFITDAVGLALLVPATRRAIGAALARRLARKAARGPEGVVDLDPEEWRKVADPALPSRSPRREPEWRDPATEEPEILDPLRRPRTDRDPPGGARP